MMTTRIALVLVTAALTLTQAAQPAAAAEPKWDQKRVLALADKLASALKDAQAAAREAPSQPTALQQRTRDAALSSFDQVRQANDKYIAKLRAGWDRDMTSAHFRSVRDGLRDARQLAGDAVPSEAVGAKLSLADDIVSELGSFYPDL